MSLKTAKRTETCLCKVAILFFYESATAAKWLENDRENKVDKSTTQILT